MTQPMTEIDVLTLTILILFPLSFASDKFAVKCDLTFRDSCTDSIFHALTRRKGRAEQSEGWRIKLTCNVVFT